MTDLAHFGFSSIDIYGTSRVAIHEITADFQAEWQQFARLFTEGPFSEYGAFRNFFAEQIEKKYSFGFCAISVIEYFNEAQAKCVTVDVVEIDDMSHRVPNLPSPQMNCEDPGGILSLYAEYEGLGFKLLQGGMKFDDSLPQAYLHVLHPHSLDELKPFEAVFLEAVRQHGRALQEIF